VEEKFRFVVGQLRRVQNFIVLMFAGKEVGVDTRITLCF
jgi:hypothetical protein